jgi:hypothetical protein
LRRGTHQPTPLIPLLSPTIVHLEITISQTVAERMPSYSPLTADFVSLAPDLRSLHVRAHNSASHLVVSNALPSLLHLESLCIDGGISHNTLQYLSTAERLRILDFRASPDYPHPQFSPGKGFPSLEDLTIKAASDLMATVLQHISSPRFWALSIQPEGSRVGFDPLMRLIPLQFPTLRKFVLHSSAIDKLDVTPLYSCRALQHVQLFQPPVNLQDQCIKEMAKAWPKLQTFVVEKDRNAPFIMPEVTLWLASLCKPLPRHH